MKLTEIWHAALLNREEAEQLSRTLEKRAKTEESERESEMDSSPEFNIERMRELLQKYGLSAQRNWDMCCYPKKKKGTCQEDEVPETFLVGNLLDLETKERVPCFYEFKPETPETKKTANFLLGLGHKSKFICVKQWCWCT